MRTLCPAFYGKPGSWTPRYIRHRALRGSVPLPIGWVLDAGCWILWVLGGCWMLGLIVVSKGRPRDHTTPLYPNPTSARMTFVRPFLVHVEVIFDALEPLLSSHFGSLFELIFGPKRRLFGEVPKLRKHCTSAVKTRWGFAKGPPPRHYFKHMLSTFLHMIFDVF